MTLTSDITLLLIQKDEAKKAAFSEMTDRFSTYNSNSHWARTIDDGLLLIERIHFDIVFIDFSYGQEVVQDLIDFAHDNEGSAPIVLLTSNDFDQQNESKLKSSIVDYLPSEKLTSSTLEQTVGHVLEKFRLYQVVQQQESQFKGFFQQSEDGIFFTDLQWKPLNVNKSFKKMFGLEKIDKSLDLRSIIISEEERPSFQTMMTESGEVVNFPISFSDDTTDLYLLVSCKEVLGLDDEVIGYQGIIRDITTFKQAEKELAQAERFSLSGRMARIIAHEVRNPLSNISLAASYLDEFDSLDRETTTQYIGILKRNSHRINDLIDKLLDSTRFSELNLSVFHVDKTIDKALSMCADRLQLMEVNVNKEGIIKGIEMQGDFEKIVIIISNIITNAIEAMEGDKTPEIELACSENDEFTKISITDNGKGMDESKKKKLFDPFFTDRHGGMGLGLSAVKHLMDQHKGAVNVESELGNGTTFSLYFPKKP